MGQDVDVKVYETRELIEKLQQWGANDIDLMMSILKECGTFLNNESQYALTENDYEGPTGPTRILGELFFWAFKIEDACDAIYDCACIRIKTAIEPERKDRIAKRLGTKLEDDDD